MKRSKSQAWTWPHLVSVQPKKSATPSLYTPDEQTEISPTTEEENSHRQCSPPRSPASSTTGSIVISRRAVVSENQNTRQDKSEINRNTEEITPLAKDSFRHGKDTGHQPAEEGAQFQHAVEESDQHAEDDNKIASELEKVNEETCRSGDECLDRWTREPCNESDCDHGEESSQSSSDASADVEEHAAHHERTPENSESSMLHDCNEELSWSRADYTFRI